jgi:predicted alpha/beta superfamily hydrolase
MRIIFLTLLLILSDHLILKGQNSDYGSNTTFHKISSNEAKDYKLKITLPNNYDEKKTYKALYYLDAWWLSELVLGSYAILNITENIDDIIFVGITLDGNVRDWNVQRTFDFTPSKYDMQVVQKVGISDHAINLDSNTTGGADIFIDFLETKVLKFVENKIPNLEKNRGFIGHSFSGLLGIYIMQKKPEIFTNFIIIAPSLWWNKPEMLNPKLFHNFIKERGPVKLHLSYGEDESNWIVKSNIKMDSIINNLERDRLEYKFVAYEKSNHNSILPRAIYDGLLYIYSK